MKEYRLLKELPWIEAGTIIIEDDDWDYSYESWAQVHPDYHDILSRIFHSSYKDFFEEIIEKKTYDTLTKEDKVYFIGYNWDIYCWKVFTPECCRSETFISKQEAEDEHKRREWANRKDKFVPKELEEYYTYNAPLWTVYMHKVTEDYASWFDLHTINQWLAFRTEEECQDAIDNHDIVRLFYTIR